jgi:hypothetical protein
MKMKYTRVYDLNDLKDLKASETRLNRLLDKFEYVRVVHVGLDKIKIAYA